MQEMTQSNLDTLLRNWQQAEASRQEQEVKKQQEEANKRGESDWDCEFCGNINQMIVNDSTSAYCKKCRKKNENIAEMLLIVGN